jgi:hypothetical protein
MRCSSSSINLRYIIAVSLITWTLYFCYYTFKIGAAESNIIQNSDEIDDSINPAEIETTTPPVIQFETLPVESENIESANPIIVDSKEEAISPEEESPPPVITSKPSLHYEAPIEFDSDDPPRFVIISMTMDAKYGFYAPITSFLWTLMGWKPVVIAMGTAESWQESTLGRVLRDAVLKTGGVIEYLPHHPKLFHKFSAGHISQISRLMVGFMNSIPEDAYVLLAYVFHMLILSEMGICGRFVQVISTKLI